MVWNSQRGLGLSDHRPRPHRRDVAGLDFHRAGVVGTLAVQRDAAGLDQALHLAT
jgi:hypothetical protein